VLDDLFLARRISEASAELLQTVVHQRYKQRRSIVVTSNRVVQDWGKYLGDATMATTILDRLMHRAAMLEFEGKSYRLKEAAARLGQLQDHRLGRVAGTSERGADVDDDGHQGPPGRSRKSCESAERSGRQRPG
jgi:hypothetical protein